jgi:hypothetical protein
MDSIKQLPLVVVFLLFSASAGAQNLVVEQAKKAGVETCLPTVEALSGFLVGNDPHGADDAWPRKNTDKQIYTSTIERVTPNGTQLSSLSVAPVKGGGCSAVYEQVQWFNTSCLVVAQEHYPKLKYKGVLANKVAVLDGPASIYLYPAGPGCLVMKKEVFTNANALKKK